AAFPRAPCLPQKTASLARTNPSSSSQISARAPGSARPQSSAFPCAENQSPRQPLARRYYQCSFESERDFQKTSKSAQTYLPARRSAHAQCVRLCLDLCSYAQQLFFLSSLCPPCLCGYLLLSFLSKTQLDRNTRLGILRRPLLPLRFLGQPREWPRFPGQSSAAPSSTSSPIQTPRATLPPPFQSSVAVPGQCSAQHRLALRHTSPEYALPAPRAIVWSV